MPHLHYEKLEYSHAVCWSYIGLEQHIFLCHVCKQTELSSVESLGWNMPHLDLKSVFSVKKNKKKGTKTKTDNTSIDVVCFEIVSDNTRFIENATFQLQLLEVITQFVFIPNMNIEPKAACVTAGSQIPAIANKEHL